MQIKRCRQRIWKKTKKKQPTFAWVCWWGLHLTKSHLKNKKTNKTHTRKTHECMYESEFVLATHVVWSRHPTREKRNGGETTRPRPALWTKTEFHTKRRGWALFRPPPPRFPPQSPPQSPRLIQLLLILPENMVIASTLPQLPPFAYVSFSCLVWRRFIKGIVCERTKTKKKKDSFLQTVNAKITKRGGGKGGFFCLKPGPCVCILAYEGFDYLSFILIPSFHSFRFLHEDVSEISQKERKKKLIREEIFRRNLLRGIWLQFLRVWTIWTDRMSSRDFGKSDLQTSFLATRNISQDFKESVHSEIGDYESWILSIVSPEIKSFNLRL